MEKLIQNSSLLLLSAQNRIKAISAVICILILSITGCMEDPEIIPKLNTLEAESADITGTTAILRGEINKLGNMNITEYGIELSESMLFSPSVTKGLFTRADTGVFHVEFTGLETGTLYYFKAYATVNTSQIYSENRPHFTTKPAGKSRQIDITGSSQYIKPSGTYSRSILIQNGN